MMNEGDIVARRLREGRPVLVAGDGATPWTLTRSADFAVPFTGLLGNAAALGEIFHITGDRGFTWDAIYGAIAAGLGVEPRIAHVPTDTLVRYRKDWEGPLLGDKTWAALFDNAKVKRVAGDFACAENLGEILSEPLRHVTARLAGSPPPESELDALLDRIAAEQAALGA